jgi:hypothetical protein
MGGNLFSYLVTICDHRGTDIHPDREPVGGRHGEHIVSLDGLGVTKRALVRKRTKGDLPVHNLEQ